jgi:hypothetical protein
MSQDEPIELSLHRVRDGELQPLDEHRYLYEHEFVTIQDQDIISIDMPDGGRAWVVGAGPNGRGAHGDGTDVEFSVVALSAQLVQVLYSYAQRGGMVLARWPPLPASKGYRNAWHPRLETALREAGAIGQELQVRSIPVAVFVTNPEQPGHLPAGWPTPSMCETAEQLFELLTD